MNLQQLIGPRFTVNVDGRASRRDVGVTPEKVEVESSFRIGSRAEQIDHLVRSEVVPVAFVDEDGTIWQLTSGGSGVVVFESADNNPLTDEQTEAVLLVEQVLNEYFGLAEKPAPKKKPKKAKQSDTLVGAAYPEDSPEEIGRMIDEVFLGLGDE